jgi:O-antigen ligase
MNKRVEFFYTEYNLKGAGITALKWFGIILLQLGIGLLCVILPCDVTIVIFFFFFLFILLYVKFQWAVYIIVFLTPLIGEKDPMLVFFLAGGTERGMLPILLVITSITAFHFIIRKSLRINTIDSRTNPLIVPVIILLLYSIISVFWTPSSVTHNMIHIVFLTFSAMAFFVIFGIVDNEIIHRRMMWCLVFSGIFLSIQTIVSAYFVLDDPITIKLIENLYIKLDANAELTTRCRGLYLDTLQTSIVLACLIPIAGSLLLYERSRSRKIFLGFAIVFFLVATFLTKSRVGIWSIMPMIFLFLFINHQLRKKFFQAVFITTLLFVIIFLGSEQLSRNVLFPESRESRVANLEDTESKGGAIGSRLYYWKIGFDALRKNSLTFIGLGAGGYNYYNSKLLPHNLYLGLFFDYGMIGVIFFSYIIFTVFCEVIRSLEHQRTYLESMSIIWAVILFGMGIMSLTYLSHYFPFVWIFLGISYSTFTLARKELEDRKKNGASPQVVLP